eukprot:TRINITY_DN14093_c0_g1_i2.p1 TRINITY_DN14093_c0_g1~~TRINITY_DN14093_c0_g1_i2.p1  ORF type:complete len:417 (+),score=96.36 TRINITY_DN14093_c0_g1_i2:73-1323(+)
MAPMEDQFWALSGSDRLYWDAQRRQRKRKEEAARHSQRSGARSCPAHRESLHKEAERREARLAWKRELDRRAELQEAADWRKAASAPASARLVRRRRVCQLRDVFRRRASRRPPRKNPESLGWDCCGGIGYHETGAALDDVAALRRPASPPSLQQRRDTLDAAWGDMTGGDLDATATLSDFIRVVGRQFGVDGEALRCCGERKRCCAAATRTQRLPENDCVFEPALCDNSRAILRVASDRTAAAGARRSALMWKLEESERQACTFSPAITQRGADAQSRFLEPAADVRPGCAQEARRTAEVAECSFSPTVGPPPPPPPAAPAAPGFAAAVDRLRRREPRRDWVDCLRDHAITQQWGGPTEPEPFHLHTAQDRALFSVDVTVQGVAHTVGVPRGADVGLVARGFAEMHGLSLTLRSA